MKFSQIESEILTFILNKNIESYNSNLVKSDYGFDLKNDSIQIIIDNLLEGAFIRGRLLNLLYAEISTTLVVFNDVRDESLRVILKKIKFKATPR